MIRGFLLSLVLILATHATSRNAVRDLILKHEKEKGIPHGLLVAIATVESKEAAHVVNAKGRAFHFGSVGEAANFVRKLQKQGVRNINVGCMQLNVPSHRRNFPSIEKMIDPDSNVSYAARLLKRLERNHGSMEHAIRYYNSSCPIANTRYKEKVDTAWLRTSKIAAASYSKKSPQKVTLGVGRKSSKNKSR